MMPLKYKVIAALEPTIMTVLMALSFDMYLKIIPMVLATFYWLYLIRKNIVKRDFKGSWKEMITSFFRKK